MLSFFNAFYKFIDGLIMDYSLATDDIKLTTLNESADKAKRRYLIETRKFLKNTVELHRGILK